MNKSVQCKKKWLTYVGSLIIIGVFIYELYVNWNQTVFIKLSHANSLQTIPCIIDRVAHYCNMSNENSTLIDIGSGDGFFLSKIISKTNFNNYIGVEIEENSHSVAISRGLQQVEFINTDVTVHNFMETPSVFYMYEPFFSMAYDEAIQSYDKLFKKMPKNIPLTIVYVTGAVTHPWMKKGRQDLLKSNMFEKYNFEIKEKSWIGSIFIRRRFIVATRLI